MTIVPDFDRATALPVGVRPAPRQTRPMGVGGSEAYWRARPVLDWVFALLLLPFAAALAGVLVGLNPVFNPGPLLFRQLRMGQGGRAFVVYKFRTMTCGMATRGAADPVETGRITPLGGLLRRMGLDELPQAVNVLRAEMSLIGPRPDSLPHAQEFLAKIPEYRRRLSVRPGISGLSQITLGYAEGVEATRAKALSDIEYINQAGFRMDLWIVWRTLVTIATGRGD
ncbi:sugar transferase [Gymnodinialimonas sp. 57CJ19]|uniref:sugar transferase n=1 Tax=Gymnodinialimonas sp. 57CJ19 TaxID=3138498 RepID=UPI0031346434